MTKIVNLKIADLKPYPENPRDNDAAVPGVVASIRQYGFIGAIIVNKDKVIINGHTRVKAMKEMGAETIPAIVVDHLTPEQERALRIADNKTGEVATWNMDLLKAELKALQEAGFDMGAMGFDTSELDELLNGDSVETGQTDPDDAPDVPEEAVSKPGEVYALGRHLLLCGDSTKAEDVAKVCGDGEADCWLTDPPYNVDYHGSDGQTIRNDSMEDSKFREFLRTAFGCAEKAMKPGAAFYVFHADSEGYNFRGACFDVGLRVRECLVWKKNALVLGRQDYQWRHEPCFYGWKDGAAHWFTPDRTQTTVWEDKPDFTAMSKADLIAFCEQQYKGDDGPPSTVIFERKPLADDAHPTMKPVRLIARQIRNSTRPGETVLDLFGGSGTTMIAAEQLGRKACLMELDERYADVIIERYEKFTGKKAQRIR